MDCYTREQIEAEWLVKDISTLQEMEKTMT